MVAITKNQARIESKRPFDHNFDHNTPKKSHKEAKNLMTSFEFIKIATQRNSNPKPFYEAEVKEVAQLISGTIIYQLYEHLMAHDFDMEAITAQIKMLKENIDAFGLVYYIVLLSDAVDLELPEQFYNIAANNDYIPFLSEAIAEDWSEFHFDYGT